MNPYRFREEDRPTFNLPYSSLIALLVIVLLGWGIGENLQFYQLNAEEKARLEELKALKEEAEREMVFRFTDAPADDIVEPDSKFLSDANHLLRTPDAENPLKENEDPLSRGTTYEVERAAGGPPSPAIQQQAQAPATNAQPVEPEIRQPTPAQKPEPKPPEQNTEPDASKEMKQALPDEPIAAAEEDAKDLLDREKAETLDPSAPKPYRPLTKSELESAKQAALKQLNIQQAARPGDGGASESTFDNPTGTVSEFRGLSMEASRSDIGDYMRILKQLVESNWRVPNIARLEVSGVTGISFNIHKDGTFTDVKIIHASGTEPLDISSLNAINNTHPAPPLPAHVDDPFVSIKFGFYYNMRPRY